MPRAGIVTVVGKPNAGKSTLLNRIIGEKLSIVSEKPQSTRNRVVVSIMATLNDLLVESRKLALKQEGRPGRSMQGHEAVVTALQRRDAEAAAEAMRHHIDQIADLLGHPEK